MSSTPRRRGAPPPLAALPAEASPLAIVEEPGANRRKRRGTSRTFYPRKRSIIACEVCRKRKSKCDNQRPSCGFCERLGTECVYREGAADHSSYDIASLDIIGRINHVTRLLEDQAQVLQTRLPSSLTDPYNSPSTYDHSNGPAMLSESLEIAETGYGTCEDVLDWPIFEGKLPRSEIESLIFNPEQTGADPPLASHRGQPGAGRRAKWHRGCAPGSGVDESNALALVRMFLANVHIKNPVLDAADLILMAKDVMENGFQWDGQSCLVLIVCALACISSPYTADYLTPEVLGGGDSLYVADSMSDCLEYATAENYYFAAQKRVGLLEVSILATQCCFLFGVYEMYSLRPIRAWGSFTRACTMLQTYLRGRPHSDSQKFQRLECRLYWSCLKSECEIRSEICLPSSGLARVDYPDVYPSPPCGSPEPQQLGRTTEADSASPEQALDNTVENSWSYYLSDIAVRRIGNRLANSFYRDKVDTWLTMPLERMVRIAEEFDLQLTQWYEYLPRLEAGEYTAHSSAAAEELTSLLGVRFMEFRERVYRPFVYIAIHGPHMYQAGSAIEPYVQRWVDACLTQALKGSHRHRHHGTWYQNRKVYGNCLLLLAAVKSGRVTVPSTWREAVDRCIAGLSFWGKEAPDLGKAKEILQTILQSVDEVSGTNSTRY